jgi:hypothetical protein
MIAQELLHLPFIEKLLRLVIARSHRDSGMSQGGTGAHFGCHVDRLGNLLIGGT